MEVDVRVMNGGEVEVVDEVVVDVLSVEWCG